MIFDPKIIIGIWTTVDWNASITWVTHNNLYDFWPQDYRESRPRFPPPNWMKIREVHIHKPFRPSSLGRRTANFAATPDEPRGKFAGAYNPPTLRNTTESKILPLSRNKLVIWAVKKVSFPHVFQAIHPPLLITLHSTGVINTKITTKTFHYAAPIS